MHHVILMLAVAGAPANSVAKDAPKKADSAVFAQMKQLEGNWTGTHDGKTFTLEYTLVSGGRCLKEHMDMAAHSMDTIYCDNGKNVVATHYCASGNQPRLQAQQLGADKKSVVFDFLDATGLSSPDEGHMHKLAVEFTDADHFTEKWAFFEKGAEKSQAVFSYARAAKK